MFYRLERKINPCKGMGYIYFARHLNQITNGFGDKNWDDKVGIPLQDLECPVGIKFYYKDKQAILPVTWVHPRPNHIRDPYLREIALKYHKNNEHHYLIFGCSTMEQLDIWFPPDIRKVMIDEFGFTIKTYAARYMRHGLRQSLLDVRTVTNVRDINMTK